MRRSSTPRDPQKPVTVLLSSTGPRPLGSFVGGGGRTTGGHDCLIQSSSRVSSFNSVSKCVPYGYRYLLLFCCLGKVKSGEGSGIVGGRLFLLPSSVRLTPRTYKE